MSGTAISSTTSSSTAKTPIFAKKVGFVIPKNKLSGSLVPVLRGAKKPRVSDSFNRSGQYVERRTKWGSDPTQDPAVIKGRALAYQTRVDQITQQIRDGLSATTDANDSASAFQSSGHRIDREKTEELELEKREAICEILKLNPSYEAPSDYKPLLKEDRVFIPVKEYPGYNFVGLIIGSGGDNKKRLEKETETKIRVYGTKLEGGEEVEIKSSDMSDAYEELYVHISADTFEKIDAAISVIELLITSVSENLAAASAASSSAMENDVQTPMAQAVAMSALNQPLVGPTHSNFPGENQHHSQWFHVRPHNTSFRPSPFIPSPNSSSSPLDNYAHVPPLPFQLSKTNSAYAPPSIPVPGFNAPHNPSFASSQSHQRPYMAQTNPVSSARPMDISSVQANNVSGPSMGNINYDRPLMPPSPLTVSAGFSNMTQMPLRIPLQPSFSPVPSLQPGIQTPVSGNLMQNHSLAPPNSGNFIFQPHNPQNPVPHSIPRPSDSNQFSVLNPNPPNAPQPQSSHFPMLSFTPQPINPGFPRPLLGNNMGRPQLQPQSNISDLPFSRNPSRFPGQPGLPPFQDGNAGPRIFSQSPMFPGPVPHHPGNHDPHQPFNSHGRFTPGRPGSSPGEQLYDPFAPTSMLRRM